MAKKTKPLQQISWVWISTVAFISVIVLAIFLITHARELSAQGLTQTVYYLILIPTGLSAAAFLFGAMKSYARYVGNFNFGQLELTGPVVVFALVVIGGVYFAKPQDTFMLTVRVHGPGGKADIIQSGTVTLDLGSQRISKNLDETGEIHFTELPQKFLNQKIELLPKVDGFQRIEEHWPREIPTGKIMYLQLQPVKSLSQVRGMVVDRTGAPLKNVDIILDGGKATAQTDSHGIFELDIQTNPGETFRLVAHLNNETGFNDYITIPESNPLVIQFNK